MGWIFDAAWRRPIVVALGCQFGVGIALQAGDKLLLSQADQGLTLYSYLAIQGILASALGHVLGLPRWWLAINFILPIGIGFFLFFEIPSWVYLAIFTVLLAVFWNTSTDRVPLYFTNRMAYEEILSLLPKSGPVRFIDLGSGLGGLLLYLSQHRPDAKFEGVESAPIPFLLGWLRSKLFPRRNLDLRYGSLWEADLADYDVVYCFLSGAPMNALLAKARQEMRPDCLFISNSFTASDDPPDRTLILDDRRPTELHLWKSPMST